MLKRTINTIREFIKLESASGILLFLFGFIAILLNNSPFWYIYQGIIHATITIGYGEYKYATTLTHVVNDGLMAIFFFLVAMEIKREFLIGELNSAAKIALPGIAALGGMLIPAIFYLAFNHHNSQAIHGWAIPVATDIAFALGVLRLLGSKIPIGLKVFLTALAIIDDLGAIIVIAIFYTKHLSLISLSMAAICLFLLIVMNQLHVMRRIPYIIVGLVLWLLILKSGVHATIAGVILGLCIPLESSRAPNISPLRELEHKLHPWVAFVILPLFAFFNVGFSFAGMHLNVLRETIPLGIITGLFLGKQIGVFGASWLAVKFKFAKLPHHVNWSLLYGVSLLCGIGFTMSLFIGDLAFGSQDFVKVGVLIGSLLSGICGYLWLRLL